MFKFGSIIAVRFFLILLFILIFSLFILEAVSKYKYVLPYKTISIQNSVEVFQNDGRKVIFLEGALNCNKVVTKFSRAGFRVTERVEIHSYGALTSADSGALVIADMYGYNCDFLVQNANRGFLYKISASQIDDLRKIGFDFLEFSPDKVFMLCTYCDENNYYLRLGGMIIILMILTFLTRLVFVRKSKS